MNDWTQGYVSDVEYLPGFYMEQAPAHLDVVCLLQGMEPPVRDGDSFAYCELGCGVGETAMAIGAANARGEVWGFDFNPAHIARGRRVAIEGGLDNVHLEEASFEQLALSPNAVIPQFDYITLHGVWAWVSAANRAHIVRFIDRHLKPGGLVYVTYNALPGWNSVAPVQRLMSMFTRFDHERSDNRVLKGLEAVVEYAEAGCFPIPVDLAERLSKERIGGNLAYLSHEYLNAHWSPCYQMDVAQDLSAAKLSYAGTANILENFPDLALTERQRELVSKAPQPSAETAKDYFMTRTFRRDVFIRGARAIPDRRLDERIRAKKLALVVPPSAVTRDIKIPLGQATLNESFYKPALEALIEAPRTIGDLLDLPDAEGATASPREVLGMLIGSRQAMALPNDPDEMTRTSARRYNAVHLRDCADNARAVCALASAGTGSAITVRLFEMLAYEALAADIPPQKDAVIDAILAMLHQRGDTIQREGQPIQNPVEVRNLLHENVEMVLDVALPLWRRVGAI